MLKVESITKIFKEIKAVDACSFEIEKGKITALVGINGSGKSTVFNLISGILKPDSGNLFFNGRNITGRPIDEIANTGVSRLFQKPRLFKNLTIRENLLLALNEEDTCFLKNILGIDKKEKLKENKVDEILEEFNIAEVKNKLSQEISFGQKRIAELARAILKTHKLLLLDEPVAGVNKKIKDKIVETLRKLKKEGDTIFIIEHDMQFVFNVADSFIFMNDGKIVAKGIPEKIKKDNKFMKIFNYR